MKSAELLAGWLVLLLFGAPVDARTIPVNTCVVNLVQIDGAVQQWALERKLTATNTYTLGNQELLMYLKGSALPRCPSGGRYSAATTLAGEPRCSLHGRPSQPIDAEQTLEDFKWRGETSKALIVSLCALLLAFLSRDLPTNQSAALKLAAGVTLAAAAIWCLNVLFTGDRRSVFPLLAFVVYATGGALAFAFLGGDSRRWIRVPALFAAVLGGVLALLAVAGLLAGLR